MCNNSKKMANIFLHAVAVCLVFSSDVRAMKDQEKTMSCSDHISIPDMDERLMLPLSYIVRPSIIRDSIRDTLNDYFNGAKRTETTGQKKVSPELIKYLSACYFKHDIHCMWDDKRSRITSYQMHDSGKEGLLKIIQQQDSRAILKYYELPPLDVDYMFWLTPQLLLLYHNSGENQLFKKEITLLKIDRNLKLDYIQPLGLPDVLARCEGILPDPRDHRKVLLFTARSQPCWYSVDVVAKKFRCMSVAEYNVESYKGGRFRLQQKIVNYQVNNKGLLLCRLGSREDVGCAPRLMVLYDSHVLQDVKLSIRDIQEYVYKYRRQIIRRPLDFSYILLNSLHEQQAYALIKTSNLHKAPVFFKRFIDR